MKIIQSFGDSHCPDGECPTLHLTDDGRVLVQGNLVSRGDKGALNVPSHEDVVVFDRGVFETIVRKFLA